MNEGTATNTLRLGRFLKEYKASAGGVAKLIIIAVVCFGVAALLLVGAVAGAQAHEFAGMVALSIFGLLFLAVSIFSIYMLFRGRGACLRLYENGLSFRRAGKESTTTWDEIDSYMQETACRITKKEGEVIEFGLNIKGADEVALRPRPRKLYTPSEIFRAAEYFFHRCPPGWVAGPPRSTPFL